MRKDIVSLILEQDGKILVERRKQSKSASPGSVILPAGHVEPGETREEAIVREMMEELGIAIINPQLVYQADYDCEEQQRIFWYKCDAYIGQIQNNEAEELLWISPSEFFRLIVQSERGFSIF